MIFTLNKYINNVYNSQQFFIFSVIYLFFTYFLLGITRSFLIIFSISYSLKLYIVFVLLALLSFALSMILPKFFDLFLNFLKSNVFLSYLITVNKIVFNFLEKNYRATVVLIFLYLFVSFQYVAGLLFGKQQFHIYFELYPVFYVIRTCFVMPFIFINVLKKHPLFSNNTNQLYMGFREELGNGILKAVTKFWESPDGKKLSVLIACGAVADTVSRVHKSNVIDTIKEQDAVAVKYIDESGAYDPKKLDIEILQKLNVNRQTRHDLDLESRKAPLVVATQDIYSSLTGKKSLMQRSEIVQKERIMLHESLRTTDYEKFYESQASFASKPLDEKPLIPSVLESVWSFIF